MKHSALGFYVALGSLALSGWFSITLGGCSSDGSSGAMLGAAGTSGSAGASAGAGGLTTGGPSSGGTSGGIGNAAGRAGAGSPGTAGNGPGTAGASNGGSSGSSGGGGAGAGAGGAGGAAGGAAGAAACGSLFCEDFESGKLDAARWKTDTQGGDVSVVQDALATGKYAARFHLDAQGDHAFIVMDAPAGTSDHLFGRAKFHVSSPSSVPASNAHTVYFTAGDGPSQKHYEVGGYDKSWQLSYWFPGGESIAAQGTVPVNQSACVEWQFDDAPGGSVRVWVDGQSNAEFTSAGGGNQFDAFAKLSFGIKFFQHIDTAVDLVLDDLAVDPARIHCP